MRLLPVPTKVPPQEAVYQLRVVPLPPIAVRVVVLPEHIAAGLELAETGATGLL
jgi:hypothetical protein